MDCRPKIKTYNIKHDSDSVEQNINIRNTNERQFRKRKRGQRLNSHHNTNSDSDYVFNDDSDLLNSDISSEENIENIDTSSRKYMRTGLLIVVKSFPKHSVQIVSHG